jgi:L-threonylcarbamoyladenylate synthase
MRTLHVDPTHPDLARIREAAEALQAGGLVAFPTETVYGLGARLFDLRALGRVFQAKGRPTSHPLIAHVLGEPQAAELAETWPELASRMARSFWPGPLTLVVSRASSVSAMAAGGTDSLAIRAPVHPVARALLRALGEPIAAPSANRYQSLSPTTAAHVARSLGDAVDVLLDGGACPAGIESTVIDVRDAHARVLRLGAIDLPALRLVDPGVTLAVRAVDATDMRPSPGMDERHYAPRATLLVAHGREDALATARARMAAGEWVGVVLRAELGADESAGRAVVHALGDDPAAYAHGIYATLHALDAEGVDAIVVEPVPDDERWAAIADRLRRGAHA